MIDYPDPDGHDRGAWANALLYSVNIQILENASGNHPDGLALSDALSVPFNHDQFDTENEGHNHGG